MNIKQIAYMVLVVDRGSLSAAAKESYVTVQAISKAISDLEQELGDDLFVRESRGMKPTPFGFAFYQKAIKATESFADLELFAQNYGKQCSVAKELRLALNTPAFPGNDVVRANSAVFIKKHLGIDVSIGLATGEKGLEELVLGEYDALVTVGTFSHPETECHPFGMIPAGVMMTREHPLVEKQLVSLSDLAPYPIGLASWFSEANETIVSKYRARRDDLQFVNLSLEGIARHLQEGGLLFTTGIPAMGKAHPATTLRLLAPDDSMLIPLCLVNLKGVALPSLAALGNLLSRELAFLKL